MSEHPRNLEGRFAIPDEARVAIVAARFNHAIVDRLVEGALDCLSRHGVGLDRVDLVKVPGAWEIPLACRWLGRSQKVSGIIALGAVIRGATAHFDFVAGEAARGCADAMRENGIPVAFGVLTTDTIEQAVERAGTKAGNKGWEAALVALEMISLERMLSNEGL
jgi:6,7-dimethyl-8-ribityllumazine synthase